MSSRSCASLLLIESMDINDVIRAIRNDDFIEGQRKKLYEEFDHAFLGIFPDFIG